MTTFKNVAVPIASMLLILSVCGSAVQPTVVDVFNNNTIHFTPDEPDRYDTLDVKALDNGRIIQATVTCPAYEQPVKLTAHLEIRPIPKDEQFMYDSWDRAGSVRLWQNGFPEVEIIKFMTAYGGPSTYDVDVTHLLPLLTGGCTINAFIDTWVTPGWHVDFSLKYEPLEEWRNPVWALPLMFEQSVNRESMGDSGVQTTIVVPEGADRVLLNYLVSGHCTDGRGADEFVPKDNVICVDGRVVYRYRPWRDDCRQFREVNPYCRRWSDGNWSSDYSRSGWCPGDMVEPMELDLTDHLTPGEHTIRFMIEDIRPKDEEGNHGYWRISSYLVGREK